MQHDSSHTLGTFCLISGIQPELSIGSKREFCSFLATG